jgi:hypothetical protein
MFQALINLFKPHKPTPVEVKVEDTVKVEEPVTVVTEPAPVFADSKPIVPPTITPLPQTVVQNVSEWPFPTQAPAEKAKTKAVKKQVKPASTTKTNSKQAPKPAIKGK